MAGRERTGSVKQKTINGRKVWVARVSWKDKSGKQRDWKQYKHSQREANDAVADKLAELDQIGDRPIEKQTVTMKQLGDHRIETDFIEPVFDADDVKRKGLISWKEGRRKVRFLVERFGPSTLIRTITYGDLRRYCDARLGEYKMVTRYVKNEKNHRQSFKNADGKKEYLKETVAEGLLTIATVRRELAELHTMVERAKENDWLDVNPFALGKQLLSSGKEKSRDMIIDLDQSEALLEAAKINEDFAPHLYPILILAFDTACRPVEWQRLKVKDIDFKNPPADKEKGTSAGWVTVRSYKGGELVRRGFGMTPRMREQLLIWTKGKQPNEFVFAHTEGEYKGQPIKSLTKSFNTAKRNAGLDGIDLNRFRLYDIRHTTATVLADNGMPEALIGPFLGHTQNSTTKRYINPDHRMRLRATEILVRHQTKPPTKIPADVQDVGSSIN
jgi:integrase